MGGLNFNDSEVLMRTSVKIGMEIRESCPANIRSRMEEHVRYMEEVAQFKMAKPIYGNTPLLLSVSKGWNH
jgi:hypothetical protein